MIFDIQNESESFLNNRVSAKVEIYHTIKNISLKNMLMRILRTKSDYTLSISS